MTHETQLPPVEHIALPVWVDERARHVIGALGGSDYARFVGGCVRNTLLSRAVSDVDIACALAPDDVMSALRAAGIKAIPTGIDHGTVTAVIETQSFEITTLRLDVQTDGRHARVAYTDDWHADALRRDFTMNTLLMDDKGNVYDPLGRGLEDCQAGRVVFVRDAHARIEEDVLRVLRFFRFYGYYGQGNPDAEALAACRASAHKIKTLSRERITQEMTKVIALPNAHEILSLMFDHNVLCDLAPQSMAVFKVLCSLQVRYDAISIEARFFMLTMDKSNGMNALEDYIVITNKARRVMNDIAAALADYDLSDIHGLKTALYRMGRIPALQGVLIHTATHDLDEARITALIDIAKGCDIPVFPVTGQDLIKRGMNPGKDMGDHLRALEQQWIDNDFTLDDDAI